MTRRNLFPTVAAFALFASAAFACPAFAAPIHVFGSSSQYGTIESETGAYTNIGRLTDSFNGASIPLSGFAFGADNNLYGVTGIDGSGANGEGNYLWRFNPDTGVSTDRRDLPIPLVTIARRPSDGRLFGYTADADTGNAAVYSFDTTTFAPTFVGTTDVITTGALTFDNSSRLYLADSFNGNVYRVDTGNAQTQLFSETGVANITGAAVVGNTLELFSTDGRTRFRVEADGSFSPAGTYDIGGGDPGDLIFGAAIAPFAVIPEAGSGVLLLGAVSLGWWTTRRVRRS
ncbi:MAG: hypothetical protein H7Y38_08005 [Armatimonadetes bacterium]|nr:hypothetical protein [Armatimonadota bacterium]